MTFDIQNDEGMLVLAEKLQARPDIAVLLKEASVDAEFDDLIDGSFADTTERMFPIFSPDQALVSAAYLDGTDNELAKKACQEALDAWGYDNIVISSLEKVAEDSAGLPSDVFMLKTERKFPVVNEDTLEKSAHYIKASWNHLNEAQRLESSVNLYKAASEFGIGEGGLSPEILAYAQKLPCDLHKLAMSISDRYAESHDENYRPMMEKIASLKADIGGHISFDEALNTGIAYDLVGLDKVAEIDGQFNAILDVFNTSVIQEELAKVANEEIVIGGYSVPAEALGRIDYQSASRALGDSLCKEASVDGNVSADKLIDIANNGMPELAEEIGHYLHSL